MLTFKCWGLRSKDNEGRHWSKTMRTHDWYLRDQEKKELREAAVSTEAQEEKQWELISQDQVLGNIDLSPFNFAVIDKLSLINFFLTNQNGPCHFSPETVVQKVLCPLYLNTQVWLLMLLESWETSRNKCVKTWRYCSFYLFQPHTGSSNQRLGY